MDKNDWSKFMYMKERFKKRRVIWVLISLSQFLMSLSQYDIILTGCVEQIDIKCV